MKKILIFALGWLACSVFDFGAMNADLQWDREHRFSNLHLEARKEAGFAMAMSMLGPIGVPVAVFETGFLEHGWTLRFSWETQ